MRRVLLAVVTAVAIVTRAQEAFGQCSITTMDINGTLTLCAVDGTDWQWTGPGGLTANTPCVDAVVEGTYTLRVWDPATGLWSDPCSYTVGTPVSPPACAISGSETVCVGASTSWCGPSGVFTYAWSGPNGFSAASACVDVSVAGTYTLRVSDPATGLASEPCSRTLGVVSCEPPSGGGTPMCPAPARWWSLSCGTSAATLDPTAFAQIAAAVDKSSAVWSYDGTADGLCAILRPGRHSGATASARRQYAAVLANLAAGELDVHARDGRRLGLRATQSLDGVAGLAAGVSLGAWVSASEATLLSLSGASDHMRSVRDELRRIQMQARQINQGARQGGCDAGLNALLDDPDDDLGWGEASMSAPPMSIGLGGAATQEPSPGGGRMRWTLQRPELVELRVVDIAGRSVRHLTSGTYSAGTHDFSWDGRDDDGRPVRSGAYFVAGRVGAQRLGERLFILR